MRGGKSNGAAHFPQRLPCICAMNIPRSRLLFSFAALRPGFARRTGYFNSAFVRLMEMLWISLVWILFEGMLLRSNAEMHLLF